MATKMLGTDAVAERLGVHPGTVRRWLRDGGVLPAIRLPGGGYRVAAEAVEAFATPRQDGAMELATKE